MKKVLYFFPQNLMKSNAGNLTRAWTLLNYFRYKKFSVDYVYSADFWSTGTLSHDEIDKLLKNSSVKHVFKLEKKPKSWLSPHYWAKYKFHRLYRDIFKHKELPNFVNPYNKKRVKEILKDNKYDYIVISYAYWADFAKNKELFNGAKLFIDTHDFLTAQEQDVGDIGKMFKEEMRRLDLFDEIWTLSVEERYLFSQFCKSRIRYVPMTLAGNYTSSKSDKVFDLIYVAGDSHHNIRAANWFFAEVFPKLADSVSICVIGKIVDFVPDLKEIQKFRFVQDLNDYYVRSRLSVCPMLSGTGVKVKVLEALSNGIPVVCSPRGADGLINKADNGCLIADNAEQFVQHISSVLNDVDLYRELNGQAIRYFKRNHETGVLYSILDDAFDVNTTI
ncbi:glycosyltransferase [Olivibacter sp. SA151]|uniref:glycosyltransferase n=1 Tax=Olivibacter jilunii TaxID=985016 RepID=UPI003F1596F3